MIPALWSPPVIPLPVTSGYAYETVSFTWIDDAREEEFCSDGSSRRVAVQFWYPVSGEGENFPLIVFSHGAFGYRMSNYSAYTELASNGYVVCSVEHPYHAIFSELDDGEVIIVDKQFMSEIVQMLVLEEKLNSMPNNLSGGQQQRVAIARALISKPAIVLADEPTGNLDSRTSSDVLGLLKVTSQKFHQTIVMITHNNEIAQLADRIIRIEDGRILE